MATDGHRHPPTATDSHQRSLRSMTATDVTGGHRRSPMATDGHRWPLTATDGHRWPPMAADGLGCVGEGTACNAGSTGLIPRLGRSPGEGIGYTFQYSWASLVAQMVKTPLAMQEIQFCSWVRKIHWRKHRLHIPVFLGFPGGSAHKESACNAGDLV